MDDIRCARRALARADRVLGLVARRFGDVLDHRHQATEPWADDRAIHWPADWLRRASQGEILAWVAHHALAWALAHYWRIPEIPMAEHKNDFWKWWYHHYEERRRAASLVETSCVLYFSARRPAGWRPLIEPEVLELWRDIPAEGILRYLDVGPWYQTIQERVGRGPVTEDPGDTDGDGDSDADGDEDVDAGSDGDPDTDGDSEPEADGDAESDGSSRPDASADPDSDPESDSDGDGNSGDEGESDPAPDEDSDSGGDSDADRDADSNGEADGDASSDTDGDGDTATNADAEGDGNADSETDDDLPTTWGHEPAPVSWRIPLPPPAEPIWVPALIVATQGSERPDYFRHHRRHTASPVLIPARRGDGVMVVSRDCSGSISQGQIEVETVAIRALRVAHPEARIVLVDHDAAVARVVDNPTDEDLRIRPCWGGTDFRPVFTAAEEITRTGTRIACLVLISADLEGDMPDPDEQPRYPVVWLASRTAACMILPFGEVIYYD